MKRRIMALVLVCSWMISVLPVAAIAAGNSNGQGSRTHQHTPEVIEGWPATCTESGLTDASYCFECQTMLVEHKAIAPLGHKKVTIPGTPATCTEYGLTEGARCSECGETYVHQEAIPPLAHEVVTDPGVAATCTEYGLTAGSHCSACGEILSKQTAIPPLNHVVVKDPGKAATCSSAGLTEGSHCSVCKTVLESQEIIPLLAHHYGDSGDAASCVHCSAPNPNYAAPGHKHKVVVQAAVKPTCSSYGLTEGAMCSECGETLVAQTVVEKLPHDFSDSDSPTCSNCGAKNPSYVEETETLPFTDVPAGSWYEPAVRYVYTNGIMNGTGDGLFSPSVSASRAMLIVMLARLEGVDTTGGSTWYDKAITWAVSTGVSDGTNPNGNITREQLVTMLWRFSGEPGASGVLTGFVDGGTVSAWAEDAMIWATQNGIISGKGNNDLDPQGNATRAQIAQIFMNYQT